MKATTFYLVPVEASHFDSEAALVEHVQKQKIDTSKFIAVCGTAHRLNPQIALLPMGEPAPKREKQSADDKAVIDEKVLNLLRRATPLLTFKTAEVAERTDLDNAAVSASKGRLLAAGKLDANASVKGKMKAKEAQS